MHLQLALIKRACNAPEDVDNAQDSTQGQAPLLSAGCHAVANAFV
jgi:hypothetical protein